MTPALIIAVRTSHSWPINPARIDPVGNAPREKKRCTDVAWARLLLAMLSRRNVIALTAKQPWPSPIRRFPVRRESAGSLCGAISRDDALLRSADRKLAALADEPNPVSGRKRSHAGRCCLLAGAIAHSALLRTESRGDHNRIDFPAQDDEFWLRNTRVPMAAGGELHYTSSSAGAPDGPAALPVNA